MIKPADNGYILSHKTEDGESVQVFEAKGESKEHIVQLLYAILECTGEAGSKHDDERVKVCIIDKNGGADR